MTALEYFVGNELSASVWTDKYAVRDGDGKLLEKNPSNMHRRLAKEFARIEKKKFKEPYSEEFIYWLLDGFERIIPQGSPMYAIGNPQYASSSNCFVVHPPVDSYGGIMRTDEELVQICKRRGGVGTDISYIRPDTLPTTNSSRRATGILPFMERFSNSIREVGQEGRRGALMLTLSVHHPQILDFARVKLDPTKVTGANVSVKLTDEFMQAVEADTDYEQRWPVDSSNPSIRRMVRAREVWYEIIKCAHTRAEPGLLFWDMILRDSPADCYIEEGFETVSTNPCSELPLAILDSCRLLVINLLSCVFNHFKKSAKLDKQLLWQYAYYAQRLMDDLVDLEIECVDRIIKKIQSDPEDEFIKVRELAIWQTVREKAFNGRRTGLGITALGDVIASLGLKYGSDKSIDLVDEIYKTLKLGAYTASVDMAEELGSFPIWDKEKEKDNPFLLRIKEEDPGLYKRMQKFGRRNIALLTTAPTGSTSILAGLQKKYFGTTAGIEPLFKDEPFIRKKKINSTGEEVRVDFIDAKGDKWTEYEVHHPFIKMWMDVTGETDWRNSPYHGCCAEDLDWTKRVKLQAVAQKHVDHAISSTINLPHDVTVEQVAKIYEAAWKEGCKGITVYRKGCRDGVLVDKKTKIPKTNAPKRPAMLFCEVHKTTVKGKDCTVFIGMYEGEPYEVFAVIDGSDDISNKIEAGVIEKKKRGTYEFQVDDFKFCISNHLSDEQAAITRLTSTALRHGTDIHFIVHQLEKVRGDLQGFSKALVRVLKKYIKDGTKVYGEKCEKCDNDSLIRQEGCVTCQNCGWSKCS